MHYIRRIAEEQNITRAAEKLFITRSALNYCLLNVEGELGFPIFKRLSNRLVPTHEGQHFLDHIEKILLNCHEMEHAMAAFRDSANQQIAIGLTLNGGQRMFEHIFPDFHRKYPNITIHLVEGNSRQLTSALLKGEIDFAFYGDVQTDPQLDYIQASPMTELMLAVSKDHPVLDRLHLRDKIGQVIDLPLLKDEQFVIMNRNSYMHNKSLSCFLEAGIPPKVMMECSSISTPLYFAEEGIALIFIPEGVIKQHPKLVSFRIAPFFMVGQTIFFRKGTQFSEPENEMIRILTERHAEVSR